MATASMDSTVRLWRGGDGTLLRVLPMVMNGVWSLAISGDGKLLVAGGGKGDVLFYDLERHSYKTVPGPPPHAGAVDRVAILPDGRRVVTLDNKGRRLMWDSTEATGVGLGGPSDLGGRLLVAASRPGPVAFALVVPGKPAEELVRLFDASGNRLADLPGSSHRAHGSGPELWRRSAGRGRGGRRGHRICRSGRREAARVQAVRRSHERGDQAALAGCGGRTRSPDHSPRRCSAGSS